MEVPVEVDVTGIAAGGDGVGRLPDGRAVFVRGAIPGDRATVAVTEDKPRFAKGTVVDVLEPGPGRVAPPCPLVAAGCGGCGWQHVAHATQRDLKATLVADALLRIGKLDAASLPDIDPGPDLPATAYRTTVRAAVVDGIAGLRVHHGHDTVALDRYGCLVAHPLVDDLLRHGRYEGATEVTVRAGVATGERLVLADPSGAEVDVPEGVVVVGTTELAGGHRGWFHEEVAGRRWRISADSFFQGRPDGAAALADLVGAATAAGLPDQRAAATVVDLYAGVGLLGGVVADRSPSPVRLQLVEANRSSAADAKANLEDLDDVRIVRADVRRWRPSAADAVIADPSRHGLGKDVVRRIAATGTAAVVLVSCDPAALGRDAGLLAAHGYHLGSATLVDLFPHTPHVEVVTTWSAVV